MSNRVTPFKKIILLVFIINCSLLITNCSKNLNPDPLPLSVKQNLAMLQIEPQFVMYMNFKKMRETEFWQKFISDSVFSSEKNFGSFLNTLKEATGSSITNGIDELFFSNSWNGDNAIVIKGTFDKNKVNEYVGRDTLYQKINYPNNVVVFKQTVTNFNFYFKDDFTVCASNYLKQLEYTFDVKDTSRTGLLTNEKAMTDINNIKFKEHLWMMSNQKLFIRGIFENFADTKKLTAKNPQPEDFDKRDSIESQTQQADTSGNKENPYELYNIYKKINAVSFSFDMSEGLELLMQNECEDLTSAEELRNKLDGIIALTKLSSAFTKNKTTPILKLMDKLKTEVYEMTVVAKVKFSQQDITELRKQKIF